jgi:hypothetical protein
MAYTLRQLTGGGTKSCMAASVKPTLGRGSKKLGTSIVGAALTLLPARALVVSCTLPPSVSAPAADVDGGATVGGADMPAAPVQLRALGASHIHHTRAIAEKMALLRLTDVVPHIRLGILQSCVEE